MKYQMHHKYKAVITNTLTGKQEVFNDVKAGTASLIAAQLRGKHFNHIKIIDQPTVKTRISDRIDSWMRKWISEIAYIRRSNQR